MSIDFLTQTLEMASQELQKRFGQTLSVREKRDASLVTDADLASEAIIVGNIQKAFPQDKIISEEGAAASADIKVGDHVWIIDPLDGTTNYANGYPFYAIAVARAVVKEDKHFEVILAGVAEPSRQRLFLAEKGKGAFFQDKTPLKVAAGRPLNKGFLVTGFYYNKGDELTQEVARFQRVAEQCSSIRRDGAAALDLAYVAAGIFDAFWEKGLALWDVAAGSLLVAEAGGLVLNYPEAETASYDIRAKGIVAGSETAVRNIQNLLIKK